MNTASMTKIENAVEPGAHSAEHDFAEHDLASGTIPPSGVKESCMQLTAPQLASVVTVANKRRIGDAEANFLAFHVAAGLQMLARWSTALQQADCRGPQPSTRQ